MAFVVRMKYVTRALLFLGGLMLWTVIVFAVNDRFGNYDETRWIGAAVVLALVQTWGLTFLLKT